MNHFKYNYMSKKLALKITFGISLFGVCFSGVLTYKELFAKSVLVCPSPGAPGTLLGYPACVYGFFMYLAIVIISAIGLHSRS
jgi:hypothetical protein